MTLAVNLASVVSAAGVNQPAHRQIAPMAMIRKVPRTLETIGQPSDNAEFYRVGIRFCAGEANGTDRTVRRIRRPECSGRPNRGDWFVMARASGSGTKLENLPRNRFDVPYSRNKMATMNTLAIAFGMPGGMEMVIFGFIILLLFGSAKLPKLMRDLGRSTNEFKAGMKETSDDETAAADKTV